MRDGKFHKWVRLFKEGQENAHDEPRSLHDGDRKPGLQEVVRSMLTQEHKTKRLASALIFLMCYHK
ncbi:hypothetical protein PR048_032490 [Dryococelus australis]|uniref:Uncharacterized protein n=1 Tax=Dryococelus australis TaxID=614101 RepID=A0ABQ9G2C7_9NEOP|nr:hypothetical protein PR048_032490 [Dryococelus australis]